MKSILEKYSSQDEYLDDLRNAIRSDYGVELNDDELQEAAKGIQTLCTLSSI